MPSWVNKKESSVLMSLRFASIAVSVMAVARIDTMATEKMMN